MWCVVETTISRWNVATLVLCVGMYEMQYCNVRAHYRVMVVRQRQQFSPRPCMCGTVWRARLSVWRMLPIAAASEAVYLTSISTSLDWKRIVDSINKVESNAIAI